MQSSHPDTAGHPQPTAPSAPAGDAAREPAAAGNAAFEIDVDKIVANALADVEAMNTVADSAAPAAPAASDDFSDLEKQIQALLNGGGAPAEATEGAPAAAEAPSFDHAADQLAEPTTGANPEPISAPSAVPSADLLRDALEQEPVDPLLREIDAALADDADALLRGSNGDIDTALRSVFDERALTGQEEEINRALIEAFGTSRVERPSFAVTNPLPNFEGAARELSPDIPRDDRERREAAAAPTVAAKNAGTDAATSAAAHASTSDAHGAATTGSIHAGAPAAAIVATAAAVSTAAAPSSATQATTPASATTNASQPAPNSTPNTTASPMASNTASSTANSTAQPAPTPATTAPAAPRSNPLAATTATAKAAIATLLALPLRALAAPARFMPASARTIVGIAAVTLVLWTPVAWWLAQKSTKTPLVGPITIKPAAAAAAAPEAEKAAEPAAGSGH
jgi:hypothetical protein